MTVMYDTAAALAVTAEDLADAIDDQRPGWPALAETARVLLGALTAPGRGPRPEPDVDAIAARAVAAPGGRWIAWPDSVWVPWHGLDDAEPESPREHGRYLAVRHNDWHGTDQPPAALWAFLAHARDDVLTLAAEVRRLRGVLTATRAAATAGEWACRLCGAAWFGVTPEDGCCPGCHAGGLALTASALPAREAL
jgi:hypothetical protein